MVARDLRSHPRLGVAIALCVYQLASATADWVMWLVLTGDGVLAIATAQALELAAIPSHYVVGLLSCCGRSAASGGSPTGPRREPSRVPVRSAA